MRDSDLNAFLASVRRTRFVDYLDPLGETAQNALERRLSWARVSQHDPAYADEARFLLDNAESLRDILRRELEEDDWIEEADVGREWETRPSRAVRMRENDRVTEIFQADDVEIGATGARATQRKGSDRSGPAPRSAGATPAASPRGPSGGRAVRSTPPPEPRDSRPAPSARSTPEPPRRMGRSPEVARRSEVTADLVQQDPAPAARSAARRSTVSTARNVPGSANNSLPPIGRDDADPPSRRGDLGKRTPSAQPGGRPGRFQTPVSAEVSLDEDEATTPMRRSEVSSAAARLTSPKAEAPIQEVDLDDWESPDDPASSTGIMRIEDVMSSGSSADHTVIADNQQTMVRPPPVVPTSAAVLDDAATRPSAATRLRRPEGTRVGTGPMPRSSLRPEPTRRRSRLPMLAMLMLGLGVVALGAGSVVAVPILYTQTDGFTDLSRAFQAAPEAPAPAPNANGSAGPAPAPAPAPSPDPAPAAPAPNEASTAASPGGTPAPSAAPTPAPAPSSAEPTPQPRAGKAPAQTSPEPVSSAPPVDAKGVWVGSTKPKESALQFTIISQADDGTFSGNIRVQLEDGTMAEHEIAGSIDGSGALTFRGGGMTFSGRVEGRSRASGTYSTRPGGPSAPWSAIRS